MEKTEMHAFHVISIAGYQKSKVSSRRIYNFCRAAKNAGHAVYLYTLPREVPEDDRYDYGFLDGVRYVRARTFPLLSLLYRYAGSRGAAGRGGTARERREPGAAKPEHSLKSTLRRLLFGRNLTLDNRSCRLILADRRHFVRLVERDLDAAVDDGPGARAVVFSSAQPGLVHMAAAALKKRRPDLYWIADYRDPKRGVGNPGFDERYSKRVDETVARHADLVTTASLLSLDKIFEGIRQWPPTLVLHNGFGLDAIEYSGDPYVSERQRIGYIGTVYRSQDFTCLAEAAARRPDRRELHYAGGSWRSIEPRIGDGAAGTLVNHGYVPLEEAHKLMASSDVLVILKKKWGYDRGRLFAKFYEYLLYDIPILVIGDRDPEFNALAGEVGGVTVVPYDADAVDEALGKLETATVARNRAAMKRLEWPEMFRRLEAAVDGNGGRVPE